MIALGPEGATSWRRRAAWLLSALLVGTAFSVAQPGPETGTAAECVPVAISAFGSEPVTWVPPVDQCFLVTPDQSGPYLMRAGVGSGVSVYAGDGSQLQENDHWQVEGYQEYELAAHTTYEVHLNQQSFAAYDPVRGLGCVEVTDLAWTTPAQPLLIDDDKLHCRLVDATPGSVLRVEVGRDSEMSMYDGDGDWLCGDDGRGSPPVISCRLDKGPGPYRLLAVSTSRDPAVPTDMSLVDIGSEPGCARVGATGWATTPALRQHNTATRWQCVAFTAGVTGPHLLRTIRERPWATFELWEQGRGLLSYKPFDVPADQEIELESGKDYRLVFTSSVARPYRVGVFDLQNDQGCRTDIDTGWAAPSSTGTAVEGGIDCFRFAGIEGHKYRLQSSSLSVGRTVSARIIDARGTYQCPGSGTPGACILAGEPPYRLLVGPSLYHDPAGQSVSYAVNLTDAASPGCEPVPLATWNQPLPLIAEDADDGSAYTCYLMRTTASTSYRFSSWVEQTAGTRSFELWESGVDPQTGQHDGYPEAEPRMTLRAHTDYRLVVSGRSNAEAVGEYRAGLFDLRGSEGCQRIADVSWSAPAHTGTAEKGELDCREVSAEAGDRFRLDWATTTELVSADGSSCDRPVCVPSGPTLLRAITEDGGQGYRFWLNELGDNDGCEARLSATDPLADPLVAVLAPDESHCFIIDTHGTGLQFWSNSHEGVTPYLISPLGVECSLWIENYCGPFDGRQTVVARNLTGVQQRSAVLLRESDSERYEQVCEPVTSAGFRGELNGIFDEECFSFELPEGTVYNMQAVGETGSAQPDAFVFGNGATCENFFCVAPGGTQTMRVINEGEGSGTYRVDLYFFHATFNLGPYLTGKPKVGSKLRVVHGGTSPAGAKVSVRWLRDGKAFDSGLTYRVRNRDRGHVIRPRVTVSSPGYLSTVVTLKGFRIKRR